MIPFIRPAHLAALTATLLLAACDGAAVPVPLSVQGAVLEARGDTVRLSVLGAASGRTLQWRSLNPDVVVVSPTGLAQAVGHGDAAVEVRAGSQRGVATVRVLPATNLSWTHMSVRAERPGVEAVRSRIVNTGGRGRMRIESWGPAGSGALVRYLRSDWSQAPSGMDASVMFEFLTPTDGVVSHVTWVVVEYVADGYDLPVRACTALIPGEAGACPHE